MSAAAFYPALAPALARLRFFHRLAAVVFLSIAPSIFGQLAITEIMSAPRTNNNFRGGDYWELTNFGTNDVSLDGYGFRDSDPEHDLVTTVFDNLVIRAGESV